MSNSRISRRSLLTTTGSVVAGAIIAGCADIREEDPTDESEQRSPTGRESDSGDHTTGWGRTTGSSDSEQRDDSFDDESSVDDGPTTRRPQLGHLHGMTGQTGPPDTAGVYERTYEWDALGSIWTFEATIQKSLVEYYKSRPRPWRTSANPHWGSFVSDPYDDSRINAIATEFENAGATAGLSDREVVDLSMKFVQQLEYTSDSVSTGYSQYARYPLETLVDRGGDCVDTSVLLSAILRKMGYGCILLALWDAEHMAVGVKGDPSIAGTYYEYNDARYYYAETTGYGWSIGEMPESITETSAEIQDLHSNPIFVHRWQTSMTDSGELDVSTTVRNVGPVSAQNTRIRVAFEDQLGIVQTADTSHIPTVFPETEETVRMSFQPPDDRTLRVNTEIAIGSDVYDMDESEWREPV